MNDLILPMVLANVLEPIDARSAALTMHIEGKTTKIIPQQ